MPSSPFVAIGIGTDGGAFTIVNGSNPFPVAVTYSAGNFPVIGVASEAGVVSGNPVRVAGWDGTNLYTVKTDTSGRQIVAGGAASGATAAGNPLQLGAQFLSNATLPAVTTGQAVALQA